MKLALISASPNEELNPREKHKVIASFPPLSLLYLAASAQKAGFEVALLDQPSKGYDNWETASWINRQNPDLVGFSTLLTSGQTATAISSIVKQQNPKITTVLGNHYATFNAHRILNKYPQIDIIVRGEGEQTIVNLANCLSHGGNLKTVKGITYRSDQQKKLIIETPDQPLIENLDSLPFPDYSLLDCSYHLEIASGIAAPKKFTSVLSSRGCVFQCKFCCCTGIVGNRWRPRSPKNVVAELRQLHEQGYRQVVFVDDSVSLNTKRLMQICQGIRAEKIDLEWFCEGRVDNLPFELAKEMAAAGCKIMFLGIESASPRMLQYYNKRITPEQAMRAATTAKRAGIDAVLGSFVLGGPDETVKEVQATLNFAKKLPIDAPQFNILSANPGNEIWNELEAKGILDAERYWETGVAVSEICPTAVPYPQLRQMLHDEFFNFFKRPSYILKEMLWTAKSSYRRNLVYGNLRRIDKIREAVRIIA